MGAILLGPAPVAGGSNYKTLYTLSSDVAISTATYSDVTGFSFPVTSGVLYRFQFLFLFTVASAATGQAFSISGPTTTFLSYHSMQSTSATALVNTFGVSYNLPAAAGTNGFGGGTTGQWLIYGAIIPSASGTLIGRCLSETAGTAITVKAGSTIEVW